MEKKATLLEISEALNLSISTVSKSLSNSHEISTKTKRRVLQYAGKVNYIPNRLAVSFRKGQTKNIGLMLPNITNSLYAKVLTEIEQYVDSKGYNLITSISNESLKKETASINRMSYGYVDGLIICVSNEAIFNHNYSHINKVIQSGIPLVLFERDVDIICCDKIIPKSLDSKQNLKKKDLKNIKLKYYNFKSIKSEKLGVDLAKVLLTRIQINNPLYFEYKSYH